MPRVALVVTGELERRGLAASLGRVFPGVDFYTDPMRIESFTSGRVLQLGPQKYPRLVDKAAGALVAAVDPGRGGTPADLAVLVEDLELENLDQPEIVVAEFRDAVLRHVDKIWSSEDRRQRARTRLRERASFHLLVPMIEAYFFSDRGVLAAAGVERVAQLADGVDLEDFEVIDTDYLAAPDRSAKWATLRRAKHPKNYLRFLIAASASPEPRSGGPAREYRETEHGVAALAELHWGRLVGGRPDHVRFARALLADLAVGLGVGEGVAGDVHPMTRFRPNVLRNA